MRVATGHLKQRGGQILTKTDHCWQFCLNSVTVYILQEFGLMNVSTKHVEENPYLNTTQFGTGLVALCELKVYPDLIIVARVL